MLLEVWAWPPKSPKSSCSMSWYTFVFQGYWCQHQEVCDLTDTIS